MIPDTFARRPVIRSRAALHRATALVVQYKRLLQKVEADQEAAIMKVRHRYAERFQVQNAKHSMPIVDRVKLLETAIARFTADHRREVFAPRSKTTELGDALLQLHDSRGFIEFAPGENRRTVAGRIENRSPGFREELQALMAKHGLQGWIVLQPDLDWTGIKQRVHNGEFTVEQLRDVGMEWTLPTRVRITDEGPK